MNTNEIVTASPAQRARAAQIWSDLEEWNRAADLGDPDYYAVWGLAHAILTTHNRPDAYAKWLIHLEAVWADVRDRHINAWN